MVLCGATKRPVLAGRARRRSNGHRHRWRAAPAARLEQRIVLALAGGTLSPAGLAIPGSAPAETRRAKRLAGISLSTLEVGMPGPAAGGVRRSGGCEPVGRSDRAHPPELPVPGRLPGPELRRELPQPASPSAGRNPFRMFNFPFPGCDCTSIAFKSSPAVLKSVRRTVSKEKFLSPSNVASHPVGRLGHKHQQIAGL